MSVKPPNEFWPRTAVEADISELVALDAAHTKQAVGSVLRTENEIRIEWKSPTFDPTTDSKIVINQDGCIVGWCEVYDFAPHTRFQSRLRVDPTLPETSVAERLIEWSVRRARQSLHKAPEGARVVMTQGAYQTAPQLISLLESAGFSYVRSFLRVKNPAASYGVLHLPIIDRGCAIWIRKRSTSTR